MYILAGIGLVFVAGEEISWGQRIIGFATPDYLLDNNIQEELNLHNIRTKYTDQFDILYTQPALIWCIIAIAAFFCGRDRLLGIPAPSFLMILGIIATSAYEYDVWSPRYLYFLFNQITMLLPLLACYALISGRVKLLPAIISATAIIGGKAYAMQQAHAAAYFPYRSLEFTEYLLGIISVWYAVEILLSQKRFAILVDWPGRGLKLPGMITPQRLGTAVCVLVIAVGIGLALLAHFTTDTHQSVYFEASYTTPAADAEQVSSSVFNVFSRDGRLYYFKDNYSPEDISDSFFLHIYPAQPSDLPASRQQYGFLNRDFDFRRVGLLSDGKCAASVALPGHPITLLVTGQYTRGGPRLWEAEFAMAPSGEAGVYTPIAGGEPLARAYFDIYAGDGNLYYIKENCAAADVDALFFLHIYPIRTEDLSVNRQQHGYQGLDFAFATHGRRIGAQCNATVELPPYSIAAIHTGQYIPDGPRLWEAEFALPSAP